MKVLAAGIVALIGLLVPAACAWGQRSVEGEAFVLVATAELNDSIFRRSVILAVPTSGDRHLGIVLNRPSRRTLADLFPEHGPSKQVPEPVYFGGPMTQRAIFALIHSEEITDPDALRIMDGVFLALTAVGVDRIIEQWPQQARFFAGNVIWRPGELREELADGYWHVMNAHPDLMFRRNTQGLWDELWRLARALTADAGRVIDPARAGR